MRSPCFLSCSARQTYRGHGAARRAKVAVRRADPLGSWAMTNAGESGAATSVPDSPPMTSMKSVQNHFGDLHVLRDIDLEVPTGQVVIVLGPSGSGKSTLCRTINRLEPIDSGTIAIDGKELPAEGRPLAALRADVGMVFQSFNLFAHKTILDNVTLAPLKVRKTKKDEAQKRAMELLERVGI